MMKLFYNETINELDLGEISNFLIFFNHAEFQYSWSFNSMIPTTDIISNMTIILTAIISNSFETSSSHDI